MRKTRRKIMRPQGEQLGEGLPLNAARLTPGMQKLLASGKVRLKIKLVNREVVDKIVIESEPKLLKAYNNYLGQHPAKKGEDREEIIREARKHTKGYARANGIPWRTAK